MNKLLLLKSIIILLSVINYGESAGSTCYMEDYFDRGFSNNTNAFPEPYESPVSSSSTCPTKLKSETHYDNSDDFDDSAFLDYIVAGSDDPENTLKDYLKDCEKDHEEACKEDCGEDCEEHPKLGRGANALLAGIKLIANKQDGTLSERFPGSIKLVLNLLTSKTGKNLFPMTAKTLEEKAKAQGIDIPYLEDLERMMKASHTEADMVHHLKLIRKFIESDTVENLSMLLKILETKAPETGACFLTILKDEESLNTYLSKAKINLPESLRRDIGQTTYPVSLALDFPIIAAYLNKTNLDEPVVIPVP